MLFIPARSGGKRPQQWLVLVWTVSALASLSGCAAVVVPTAVPQERPFVDTAEEHLKPGVTTAADVSSLFGPPHWRAASAWIYRHRHLGWGWAYCAVGYEYGECGVTERATSDYVLRVSFGDDGVLTDYSVQTQRDLCEDERVCIVGDLLSVAAPDSLAWKSKQFSPSPDSCQVYLFPENRLTGWRVYLDDRNFGALVSGASYVSFSLPPGLHHADFFNTVLGQESRDTPIDCRPESLHYIRLRSIGRVAVEPKLLDESDGRREVEKRWMADPNPPYEAVERHVLRNGEVVAFLEGDALTLYEFDKGAGVTSFGTSPSGEICGLRSGLVDYRLTPAGGRDSLYLLNRKGKRVQLAAVCNAEGECELPSLFGEQACRTELADSVTFVVPAEDEEQDLLVIEPAVRRKQFQEVYFGSAAKIAERATCHDRSCELDLVVLRRE